MESLDVVRADRGVCVIAPGTSLRIELVEHLAAALAGAGLRSGLAIEVDGPEVPLLDGGALDFAAALRALIAEGWLRPEPTRLAIARCARFSFGATRYAIAPGPRSSIGVRTSFPPPIGAGRARWDGDADDFFARIAPARTFGFRHEYAALLATGRARGAAQSGVLVLESTESSERAGAPAMREPVLHKLLDLIGDLALYGGPPAGIVVASRPGHATTHAFMCAALASGAIVTRDRRSSPPISR